MRDVISQKAIEYFGRTYKGRTLPRGVYLDRGKYRAMIFDEKGHTIQSKSCDTAREAIGVLKIMKDDHHWFGIKHDPLNNFGFLYRITEKDTGRMYIGKKQYRFWDGPRGGYKCTDVTDDTWFDESLWKESDWRYYRTSAPLLAQKITADPTNYLLETISLHKDKLELHLAEIALQLEEDVLHAVDDNGEYKYYNGNIASQEFRPPVPKHKLKEMEKDTLEKLRDYIVKPQVCKCGVVIPYGEAACH